MAYREVWRRRGGSWCEARNGGKRDAGEARYNMGKLRRGNRRMKRSTIELEIPSEIVAEARGIARDGNRSVESVLQDGLVLVFGSTTESDVSAEILQVFSDEQLWKIVNRRMPWAQDSRLRELTAQSKQGSLTQEQREELDCLLTALDRQILLRSRALLLMKKRGHDVDSYLGI